MENLMVFQWSKIRVVAHCLCCCLLYLVTSLLSYASETGGVKGESLYQRHCGACHMGDYAPHLSKYFLQRRESVVRTKINEGGVAMPGFKYRLNAQQIDDIMAYLLQLESAPQFMGNNRVDP